MKALIGDERYFRGSQAFNTGRSRGWLEVGEPRGVN